MLENISFIIGILSFLITILTFIFTIKIRKQLKRVSDKQQFLRDRHIYISEMEKFYNKINTEKISFSEILKTLRDIHRLMEQIKIYKIWDKNILLVFNNFINETINAAKEIESYANDPVKRRPLGKADLIKELDYHCQMCSPIYTPSYNSRYSDLEKTIISEKFKIDYCIMFSKIIAIIKTDSNIT